MENVFSDNHQDFLWQSHVYIYNIDCTYVGYTKYYALCLYVRNILKEICLEILASSYGYIKGLLIFFILLYFYNSALE
jgi:hypothetical protein